MTTFQIASNPFAQMMDPAAVIAAVERSERLQRLHSRICRPLDKVLVTAAAVEGCEVEAIDGADLPEQPSADSDIVRVDDHGATRF